MPRTEAAECKIPPPPMPWRYNLYETQDEPGIEPTLQSEMGLTDDHDLFSTTLANIREIWRQHGVDRNVSYMLQDPETMAIVKERALNEMPFLRERYEDGWPVTMYLKRSLQPRMTVAAQRQFDEGPYRYRGRRFVVVDPDDLKDKRRSSSHPIFPTKEAAHPVKSETRRPAKRQRADDAFGSSRLRQSTKFLRDTTSPFPFVDPPPTSSASFSSQGSSSAHSSPEPESPTDREAIVDLLRSYALPLDDAEHIMDLLADHGVSNMADMRVLARRTSTRGWLREQRDKGELTEVQMRLLREILGDLATTCGACEACKHVEGPPALENLWTDGSLGLKPVSEEQY